MKNLICLFLSFAFFMQGCSQEDFVDEVFILEENMKLELPKDIEDYGKAVAAEMEATLSIMIKQGVDYSEVPDSIDFRERFFTDWYAANPKIVEARSTAMEIPNQMSVSEFAERYRMLTTVQIDYIIKIIKECEQSTSNVNLLERLIVLKDDICLHIPEYEQERLLYIISVLYYGIQKMSEMEAKGLTLNSPYSYSNFQLSRIKSRTETGTLAVPEGCRSFLATVWTIAVGEPTPAGEIVAAIATIYVAGVLMYEVVTCKKNSYSSYCLDKYVECQDTKPEWAKKHSGGYGHSMCQLCFDQCNRDGYWMCPVPV